MHVMNACQKHGPHEPFAFNINTRKLLVMEQNGQK